MKRLLLGAAILAVAVGLVVLSGAASPAGHATGFNFGQMNKIQKKLASVPGLSRSGRLK